ncbi:hypothetical protein Hypma_012657 [Hypsizygus marmoreus]|uniref:Uncharacterized protein n=1 Tax=Hypsizygus marmoreus TaxID=39966 RepID=A0A369JGC6_HYPMA|nr:hypothetical protein Hypma_012657 [Hypsizygus marmoreus]
MRRDCTFATAICRLSNATPPQGPQPILTSDYGQRNPFSSRWKRALKTRKTSSSMYSRSREKRISLTRNMTLFSDWERNKRQSISISAAAVGNDVRKAMLDGYPAFQVIASDLGQEFRDLGHRLFRSTPYTFPVSCLCGDIFEDYTHKICQPSETLTAVTIAPPILSDLGSLTPLLGRVTTIHVAALFYLFDEPSQFLLAQCVASLLSPISGSMIFGSHVGRPVKGLRSEAAGLGALGASMFCHSKVRPRAGRCKARGR